MKLIKAVLIIDVQKALCCGEGATYRAEDVIANINELNRKARESDIPVIFIQHETKEGDFSKDSDGWKFPEELVKTSNDITIAKKSSDAFKDTELKIRLEAMKINHLIVCGMQSEFCVDSTIRCALALNYSVTVVEDGHTTVNNEAASASTISKHHNITWENITSYGVRAKAVPTSQIDFEN